MTHEEIIRRVAKRTGVHITALRAPNDAEGSRTRKVSHARHRAMWALRQVKGPDGKRRFSQTWVGRYFGGRDHTAVVHAERSHAARRAKAHDAWRGRSRLV